MDKINNSARYMGMFGYLALFQGKWKNNNC